MEHAEEALVFANVYRDTKTEYFETCQGPSAIKNEIYYRLPGRLARLPCPQFVNAANAYSDQIALLLPAFLNEKKRRVRWGADVATFAAVSDVPFFVSEQFPADVLRRPGLPAPGAGAPGGDDDDDDDDTFSSEDWRLLDAAYDAAVDSGEVWGPKKTAEGLKLDAQFDARIAAHEAREAEEATAARVIAADEELEADAIREAIEASRDTYARQLSSFRELSVEPIPSGSQGFPAQHVDPSTGVAMRGTFLPMAPATPSQGSSDSGTWVFVPRQSPAMLQPRPVCTALLAAGTGSHHHSTPSGAQGSTSKGKGKAPAR